MQGLLDQITDLNAKYAESGPAVRVCFVTRASILNEPAEKQGVIPKQVIWVGRSLPGFKKD